MVRLEVQGKILDQPETLEEAESRLGVEIILMGERLSGLGLEEELARETDLPRVVAHHSKEARVVLLFTLHVRVEERLVAVTAWAE